MKQLHVYLAGPMRGIPYFNFPAFMKAAEILRKQGYEVFNPAERDVKKYGKKVSSSPTGNIKTAKKTVGFSLREALNADMEYICLEADAIALLPGWKKSKGACAEHALAVALDHEIYILDKTYQIKD